MRVRVVSVGRDRSGLFQPAADEYAGRIARYCPIDLLELKESRGPRAKDDEGDALLAKAAGATVVALDQRGKALASEELAAAVERARRDARDLAFLVGGDEGLSDAVRAKAAWTFSLSKLTLPHRLARVVLLEQLYRAFTILRGEPYHK